jgi:hypothetical protein
MKTIKKFPVWFAKQRLSGRIFLVFMGLLIVFGLGSLLVRAFTPSEQTVPTVTVAPQGADGAVINNWTPTPTTVAISGSSPSPLRTPLPTGLPTLSFDTPTVVVLPTFSRATAGVLVLIIYIDKQLEFVDIQNAGGAPADLRGWVLVSETGDQTCNLKGTLLSKQVLRIWAGTGQVGLSCGFKNPIWLDEESDPAVLYNAKGEEVSRYP